MAIFLRSFELFEHNGRIYLRPHGIYEGNLSLILLEGWDRSHDVPLLIRLSIMIKPSCLLGWRSNLTKGILPLGSRYLLPEFLDCTFAGPSS